MIAPRGVACWAPSGHSVEFQEGSAQVLAIPHPNERGLLQAGNEMLYPSCQPEMPVVALYHSKAQLPAICFDGQLASRGSKVGQPTPLAESEAAERKAVTTTPDRVTLECPGRRHKAKQTEVCLLIL